MKGEQLPRSRASLLGKLRHSRGASRAGEVAGRGRLSPPAKMMADAPSLVVAAWPVVRHLPSAVKKQVPADGRLHWPTKALAASLVLMAVAANVVAFVGHLWGAYAAVPGGFGPAARSWLVSAKNATHPPENAPLEDAWSHINRKEAWYYAGISLAGPGVAMVLVNSWMFWTALDLQVRAR